MTMPMNSFAQHPVFKRLVNFIFSKTGTNSFLLLAATKEGIVSTSFRSQTLDLIIQTGAGKTQWNYDFIAETLTNDYGAPSSGYRNFVRSISYFIEALGQGKYHLFSIQKNLISDTEIVDEEEESNLWQNQLDITEVDLESIAGGMQVADLMLSNATSLPRSRSASLEYPSHALSVAKQHLGPAADSLSVEMVVDEKVEKKEFGDKVMQFLSDVKDLTAANEKHIVKRTESQKLYVVNGVKIPSLDSEQALRIARTHNPLISAKTGKPVTLSAVSVPGVRLKVPAGVDIGYQRFKLQTPGANGIQKTFEAEVSIKTLNKLCETKSGVELFDLFEFDSDKLDQELQPYVENLNMMTASFEKAGRKPSDGELEAFTKITQELIKQLSQSGSGFRSQVERSDLNRRFVARHEKPITDLHLDGAKLEHIVQGNIGDCFFVAGVSAVFRQNPEQIKQMIVDCGDHVEVQFYEKDEKGGMRPAKPVIVPKMLLKGGISGGAGFLQFKALGGMGSGESSNWFAILEKAYAIFAGGNNYAGLDGGHSSDVIAAITGRVSTVIELETKYTQNQPWTQNIRANVDQLNGAGAKNLKEFLNENHTSIEELTDSSSTVGKLNLKSLLASYIEHLAMRDCDEKALPLTPPEREFLDAAESLLPKGKIRSLALMTAATALIQGKVPSVTRGNIYANLESPDFLTMPLAELKGKTKAALVCSFDRTEAREKFPEFESLEALNSKLAERYIKFTQDNGAAFATAINRRNANVIHATVKTSGFFGRTSTKIVSYTNSKDFEKLKVGEPAPGTNGTIERLLVKKTGIVKVQDINQFFDAFSDFIKKGSPDLVPFLDKAKTVVLDTHEQNSLMLDQSKPGPKGQDVLSQIKQRLKENLPVCVGTYHWDADGKGDGIAGEDVDSIPGMVSGHAYELVAVEQDPETKDDVIVLRNPWGSHGAVYNQDNSLVKVGNPFYRAIKSEKDNGAETRLKVGDFFKFCSSVYLG